MDWLNYHHLLYFWTVAREGSVARAAERLRLAHPTVSAQIHALEDSLGEKLLERRGRNLVLTEMGTVVLSYANEIFGLGRELVDTVKGRPTGRPLRLAIGISQMLPKLITKQWLAPAFAEADAAGTKLRILCREDSTERLLNELVAHRLDVVFTDRAVPAGSGIRAYNHLLGECGLTIFATKTLAAKHKKAFPRSLHGAPLPATDGRKQHPPQP
jgi:LysR family transcriptional activator of nhaA